MASKVYLSRYLVRQLKSPYRVSPRGILHHAALWTSERNRRGPLIRAAHPLFDGGRSSLSQPLGHIIHKRSLFIQTQDTPNADALKFIPNCPILDNSFPPSLEYLSPRSTISPPYPSSVAAQLLNVNGVSAVFFGRDYVTVTKANDVSWSHIKPEIFSLITEAVTSGSPFVSTAEGENMTPEQAGSHGDSLRYDEADSEVVGMIKELLETRIRPAIQDDGGDIEFRGFRDGMVLLKLRGACRTCDSSTVTLRNGIESMLMHYIEEVKGITQVLDEEEEESLRAFAKFEEGLKQRERNADD